MASDYHVRNHWSKVLGNLSLFTTVSLQCEKKEFKFFLLQKQFQELLVKKKIAFNKENALKASISHPTLQLMNMLAWKTVTTLSFAIGLHFLRKSTFVSFFTIVPPLMSLSVLTVLVDKQNVFQMNQPVLEKEPVKVL